MLIKHGRIAGAAPHLRILGQVVQGGNFEVKLLCLSEFPEARPQGHQIVATDAGRLPHYALADIVHPLFMKPEAIRLIWPVNKLLYIAADTAT